MGVGEKGLGEISPSLSVLFRLIFQNLRKSLTIYTKFSYFYYFKLCGIVVLRSEDEKNKDMHTHTKPSIWWYLSGP